MRTVSLVRQGPLRETLMEQNPVHPVQDYEPVREIRVHPCASVVLCMLSYPSVDRHYIRRSCSSSRTAGSVSSTASFRRRRCWRKPPRLGCARSPSPTSTTPPASPTS